MTPAVSIVIPTFRRPERAVEAARSALAQEGGIAFEIVLVDNDPAGSALDALRALCDPRVTIVHEPRAGVVNARNAGLRAARGELIAFPDGRFVEGVGKLLWFPVIKPRFYGAAKTPKSKPAAAQA